MRLHLFEFNDQPWLPATIRNWLTAYLLVAYRSTPFGGMFGQRVAALMKESGSTRIVDLCSGAGGPIAIVKEELERAGMAPRITMTDLFPNRDAIHPSIDYWPEPVDARAVPKQLTGMRTMFAGFHHFEPSDATRILRSAFEDRCAIGVFELTARTPVGIAGALLIPFGVLLMTPRIRPVSIAQLLFTYLIPILPLIILWDGMVSQWRTYTPDEMRAMTKNLDAIDYEWESGMAQVPGTPLAVPYLTGRPRSAS